MKDKKSGQPEGTNPSSQAPKATAPRNPTKRDRTQKERQKRFLANLEKQGLCRVTLTIPADSRAEWIARANREVVLHTTLP